MSMPADLDEASITLYQSAVASDMRGVTRAVGHGADVETADTEGLTMLMMAARRGHVEMANFLLGANASIAARTLFHFTALHVAVVSGKLSMVKLLLKQGASVSGRTCNGETPLALFARYGHTDAILELVRAGSDVNAADNEDVTVLIRAAGIYGGGSVVQALLESGADPTRRSSTGASSCHFAVSSGDPLVVRALLRAGGPVGPAAQPLAAEQLSMRNADGITPLHLVVGKTLLPSLFEMLRVLDQLEDDMVAGESPWAQLVGGEKGWRSPTDKALSVQDERGRTALHLAAAVCFLPAVRALLRRGAIETQRDNSGYAPQDYVTEMMSISVNGVPRPMEGVAQRKAIARCLARGPAFVARSLLWPATTVPGGPTDPLRSSPVWRVAGYTRRPGKSTKRAFVAAIFRYVEKD